MKIFTALFLSLALLIPVLVVANQNSFPQNGAGIKMSYDSLSSHNELRAIYRQRPLKASKDLTQIAQKWANQLARSCKMYHQKNAPVGENIFWSGATTNVSQAIYEWGKEAKNYDLEKNTCPKGKQCYHFTQMVWAGTTEVGCAKQLCTNKSGQEIYVCNYFPAGNIVGARPFKPEFGIGATYDLSKDSGVTRKNPPKSTAGKELDKWEIKMKMKF